MTNESNRRDLLKQMMGLPVLGGLSAGLCAGGLSWEERHLLASTEGDDAATGNATTAPDAVSGATRTSWNLSEMQKLNKKVPMGKLGNLDVSRLTIGGNLIGGWAHARDLIYVSELVKRYHTKDKVYQTFWLAEQCGINTFMGNPIMYPMMADYYSEAGGNIQFISDCGGGRSMSENFQDAIDNGCAACYVHGGVADYMVANEQYDEIIAALETGRKNGVPVGIGAHFLETCLGVAAQGIVPDFWMKTYHTNDHFSAQHGVGGVFDSKEYGKVVRTMGSYCPDTEKVREFMATRKEPWVAFKVLGAGAIEPRQGFRHAFEGGADFICVGIYDFQMVEDANICTEILDSPLNRTRNQLA